MKEERLEPIIVNMHFDSLEETSEKILKKMLETHFRTVFVGAVCHIEDELGSLWGESEDFDESKLTEEQKIWYEKFLNLRDKIFNQGNREKKIAISKLKSFYISLSTEKNG